MEEQFNFCVGYYREASSSSIGCYAYVSEVQYGTIKEATNFCDYVKSQSPTKDWKIFKVVELDQ